MTKNLSYAKKPLFQFFKTQIHKMKVFLMDLQRMPSYLVRLPATLKSYRIVSL